MNEFAPGDVFADKYTIEAVAGHGAMGVVYRALDQHFERPVAIKLSTPALADLPNFSERLLREARLAAQIEHPGVVRIHDVGELDGRPYVVLRWIDGTDLRTRLAAGPLPQEEVLSIVEQLGDALDAAHEVGCLHRDVKPANVLVRDTPSGPRAYLTDFGVAKAMQELTGVTTLTSTGEFAGTPAYLAPELANGAEGDRRADIYGLACVAFEMLSGTPPFEGPTPAAMLVAHCVRPRPLLSQRRPGLPDALDRLLADAMSVDPDDRPGSGMGFAHALHDALGGVYSSAEMTRLPSSPGIATTVVTPTPGLTPPPAPARPPSPRATPRKTTARGPRGKLAIAGACVAVLLGGGAAAFFALGGEEDRATAATGGVPTAAKDDPFALAGAASRVAVADLFNAYAEANRRKNPMIWEEVGYPLSLEFASGPKDTPCGSLVRAEVDPKLGISDKITAYHKAQWRAGAAPVKLVDLDPRDIEVRTPSLRAWEGEYESARRGNGRVRLFAAFNEYSDSTWQLFKIDFCPSTEADDE